MIVLNMSIHFGAPRRLESPARAIYGFFNRYSHLLEPLANHGKQTLAPLSNRYFFRISRLASHQSAHREATQ